MHEYPIFKHLVQFSNLIDSNGNLIQEVPRSKPEELKKSDCDSSVAKKEELEGGEQVPVKDSFTYEGGDSSQTNTLQQKPPNATGQ